MKLREFSHVPVIDVAPLVNRAPERTQTAEQIGAACRESGFFYVVGHGVDEPLCALLEKLSRGFFDQNKTEKLQITMSRGGRAWRGYFPVGGELTSGKPDRKEGLYFGTELEATHPAVLAGRPLHVRGNRYGLNERRKIKELQEVVFPGRVKEIEEICGLPIPDEVDWDSLSDLTTSRVSTSSTTFPVTGLTWRSA